MTDGKTKSFLNKTGQVEGKGLRYPFIWMFTPQLIKNKHLVVFNYRFMLLVTLRALVPF